jgi:hypothetical protein
MSMPLGAVSAALDLVRARLLGGTPELSIELLAVCFRRVLCEGDSANSSPEASREEGCNMSAVDVFATPLAAVRLRLEDPVDEGEDIRGAAGRADQYEDQYFCFVDMVSERGPVSELRKAAPKIRITHVR